MINCFANLQFRLIVGFVLVLALSLGSLTLFANFLADREGERYEAEVSRARNIRVWRAAQQLPLENSDAAQEPAPASVTGAELDWYLLIKDASGQVVGASQEFELPSPGQDNLAWIIPLYVHGEQVGRLMVRPMGPSETTLDAPSPRLVSAFRNSLIWTGVVTAVLGIVVIYFLTRKILVPVRQLTAAAQQVGRGQLSQVIPANGKDEIGKLAHTFNLMTRELEAAEAERRRMLADVAHELRTPLTNAQGYIEAIRDGLKEPGPTTIDAIYRQILQLHRLVDDLRLLTLAESGNLDLNLEAQPLSDLLGSVVDSFGPRAQSKEIKLVRHFPPDLPEIPLDRARIAQVLGNLLENAIMHTPGGGSVTLEAYNSGDRVVISVSDTGEGIPPEALPHVFDRLYRHDRSRNRASGGSGLGLSIAKQLVEAHGGTIAAESRVGVGSRFHFTLLVNLRVLPRVRALSHVG
jgi:signal transduction histidine kinase